MGILFSYSTEVRRLAAEGLGWEDVMVKLNLNAPAHASFVRATVLRSGPPACRKTIPVDAAQPVASAGTERGRG